MKNDFSQADIRQIEAAGLTIEGVLEQLAFFTRGPVPLSLNRPCTINDGIVTLNEEEEKDCLASYDEAAAAGRCLKFVPASGLASRMFKNWYRVMEKGSFDSEEEEIKFVRDLKNFPFFDDLRAVISRKGDNVQDLLKRESFAEIIRYILTSDGLNYGCLPKALLKFHNYPGANRTAFEEHLVEAAMYVQDRNHICRLHFTVSIEHKEAVEEYLHRIRKDYENLYGVRFDIDISVQFSSTDTLAVDMENIPVRNHDGSLVFRRGGHGALLENLNQTRDDFVFIKNIDNVVPDRLKSPSIRYKKILGGYMLNLQKEMFRYLRLLSSDEGKITEELLKETADFCVQKLNITFPAGFSGLSLPDRRIFLYERLNRPLRVCGMVKNEGEPGGSPFWTEEGNGALSLQIVEAFQIDNNSQAQRDIWSSASHFNPVDLVCGISDCKARKFDLHQFVNHNAISISNKYLRGRKIKALELPGLWNGSMYFWNTVFVEVPVETFNPVKTVNDLLKEGHQS